MVLSLVYGFAHYHKLLSSLNLFLFYLENYLNEMVEEDERA